MPKPPRKPHSSSREKFNGHSGDRPPARPKPIGGVVARTHLSKSLKSIHAGAPLQRWKNITDALAEDIARDYEPPDISDDEVTRMRVRLDNLAKAALSDYSGPLPETPQEKIAKLRDELRGLAREGVRRLNDAKLQKATECVSRIWEIERTEGLPWSHPEMEIRKAFKALKKSLGQEAVELATIELALKSITDIQKPEGRKRRKK